MIDRGHQPEVVLFLLEGLLFFVAVFLVSWALTWVMRAIALRHNLLDIPNQRSSHSRSTPRGGGLSIILAGYLGWTFLVLIGRVSIPHLLVLAGCGAGVALVGFLDDLFHLSAFHRIVVHFGCALAALFFFNVSPGLPLTPITAGIPPVIVLLSLAVGVVWFVNLYNFMDGIDGLAGVEAVTVALGACCILSYLGETEVFYPLLLVLAAAVLGFLTMNWPPAKIFMGDGGSGFLGFFFGMVAILSAQSTRMTLWTWLILLGVFVVDASVTLLVRGFRGEKVHQAHRSHAYQILARRFCSHKKVTFAVLAVNVLWLFPWAFFSVVWPAGGPLFTVLAFAPLVVTGVLVGAGRIND